MAAMQRDRSGSGFAALVAAATAIEAHDERALADALQLIAHERMLQTAAQHRCLGYLRRGILQAGLRDARALALTHALRDYAGKAAMQAYAVRKQVDGLVIARDAAGIPFTLLKGAARLFRGDREADSDTMFDLDVLVPLAEIPAAITALSRAGYQSVGDRLAHFWKRHHHAQPLRPPGLGLPVELHYQLAPPADLSIATDWNVCQRHCERVKAGALEASCLDSMGTALHMVVHGVGLRRLHDVIMLARILRDTPGTGEHLESVIAAETRQGVALRAVLVLAARIAAMRIGASEPVKRYLEWVQRREDLTPYIRQRTQLVDAWYTNDRKLLGPATRLALPTRGKDQSAVAFGASFAYRLVGRILVGAYAAATNRTTAMR